MTSLAKAKRIYRRRVVKLVIKKASRGRPPSKRECQFSEIVDIANSSKTAEVCSEVYQISNKWVNVLREFVAGAVLHYQSVALSNVLEMAQQRRPSFVMWRLAYDETGEKVTVPCVGLGPQQQASTWQVMVSRLEMIVGWSPTQVVKGIIILPALLVTSPTSENMYNCLYYHKLFQPIQAVLRLLLFSLNRYSS
jgi:hypothetical protein